MEKLDSTIVVCKCVKKGQSQSYSPENPVQHEIELAVPYDQKSIYYQLSGGTGFILRTINQKAADMFEVGKDYDVVISATASKA